MRLPWPIYAVGFLAVLVGAGLGLQRGVNQELREEVALLREQNRVVGQLRADQQRLRAAQISAEKLASLRADHAAVERLRGEVENLRTRVREMEQAVAP